jgi:DNA-binding NarL/FixJ family response regulator
MNSTKSLIMVIDDHPIIHDGLKTLLKPESDLHICATATSASEAVDKLDHKQPDLAIIDLSLGDSDGTYLIQRLRIKYPKMRILVYSMSEEKLFAERAAIAGADGYVMKTSPPSILKQAIRSLLAGKLYFPAATLKRIKKRQAGRSEGPQSQIDSLSNREMDIFKLIGQGMDSLKISDKLNISRNTVDTHRINIKNKLELPNGKALDRLAFEVIQQGKMPD